MTLERRPGPEPGPAAGSSRDVADAEEEAEAALVKGIERAIGLLENGSFEQVRKLLEKLKREHGGTKAYRNRLEELKALKSMADAG